MSIEYTGEWEGVAGGGTVLEEPGGLVRSVEAVPEVAGLAQLPPAKTRTKAESDTTTCLMPR
jgi:hypothetical protein